MFNIYLRKKGLVSNFVDFLVSEGRAPHVSEKRRSSIQLAIDCLKTAFDLSKNDREVIAKIDLLAKLKNTHERHEQAEECRWGGSYLLRNGDIEGAIGAYTMAIDVYPEDAVAFYLRADAFSRIDYNLEAIDDCRQALTLDADYGKAYGLLGAIYSKFNDWEEALKAYENAFRFEPMNVTLKINMHLVRQKLFDSVAKAVPRHLKQSKNNRVLLLKAQMTVLPQFRFARVKLLNRRKKQRQDPLAILGAMENFVQPEASGSSVATFATTPRGNNEERQQNKPIYVVECNL